VTFHRLDFVYMPSADVAADVEYFTSVLGGRLIFAVEGMGTRVAMVELTEDPPRILLAGHLEGDQAVLVYRVDDLAVAMHELEAHGWEREPTFEIPHGPVSSFRTPGGHRIAIYQLVRPEVGEHFAGRRDF
jgi:catechol 2,3-dioxygenase-like lactoylglutathione lyase family enzyme